MYVHVVGVCICVHVVYVVCVHIAAVCVHVVCVWCGVCVHIVIVCVHACGVCAYGGGGVCSMCVHTWCWWCVCVHGVWYVCMRMHMCVRAALLHPWREEMNALAGEEGDTLPRAARHQRAFRRGKSALPVESLFCPAGPKIQLKKE